MVRICVWRGVVRGSPQYVSLLRPFDRWRGKGKRSGGYGSFLVAVQDEASGRLASFSCVGTGFSDDVLAQVTQRLEAAQPSSPAAQPPSPYLVSPRVKPDVWLHPTEVRGEVA